MHDCVYTMKLFVFIGSLQYASYWPQTSYCVMSPEAITSTSILTLSCGHGGAMQGKFFLIGVLQKPLSIYGYTSASVM